MHRERPLSNANVIKFQTLCLLIGTLGCHAQPPGGVPIQPTTLGSVVDEANRIQEENAERAKLIVYMNEFEINLQHEPTSRVSTSKEQQGFEYEPELQIRGIRLTPDGQDHVRRIAKNLLDGTCPPNSPVMLERSDTSKHWDTKHHYPVHFNDELDTLRREVLVQILTSYGIQNAAQLVVVAPAFSTGLNAEQATMAYDRTMYRGQQNNRSR